MTKSRSIDWRGPNWLTFFLLVGLIVAYSPEVGLFSSGRLSQSLRGALGGGVGALIALTGKFYGVHIKRFQPIATLEAKRANEQIKSLAGTINALAAGTVVATVAFQVGQEQFSMHLIFIALGAALWANAVSRNLLGLLKDDNVRSYANVDDV